MAGLDSNSHEGQSAFAMSDFIPTNKLDDAIIALQRSDSATPRSTELTAVRVSNVVHAVAPTLASGALTGWPQA